MNRPSQCLQLIAPLFLLASPLAAQDVPAKPSDAVAKYLPEGLSPLYQTTGDECQKILNQDLRWSVLPRTVSSVLVSPESPPIFAMQNGDSYYNYYNGLFGKDDAIRRTLTQTWNGGVRLLYNTTPIARDGDDLWFESQGRPNELTLLSGNQSSLYRTLGSSDSAHDSPGCFLAKQVPGIWCIASSQGLYRLENEQWERILIPGWPGGLAEGMVSDGRGRIVAWSKNPGKLGPTVAIFADGAWSSVEAVRGKKWTTAGIRADGVAILAGPDELAIVMPPRVQADTAVAASITQRTLNLPLGEGMVAEVQSGSITTSDGKSRTVYYFFGDALAKGLPVVTRHGGALFETRTLADGSRGLIRLPPGGPPQWIDFEPAVESQQMMPTRDDGFVIFSTQLGAYLLTKDTLVPRKVAEPEDFRPSDTLLGCDRKGQIYFGRENNVLKLSPDAQTMPELKVEEICFWTPVRHVQDPGHWAALTSSGHLWCAGPNADVTRLMPGKAEPQRVDDRLRNVTSLWPGRNGAMLCRHEESAALATGDERIGIGESLVALAKQNFTAMLAVAPLASRDERRAFTTNSYYRGLTAPPWLAIGTSLWISDGKSVQRIRKQRKAVVVQEIRQGKFTMLGPLASGHLLLAPSDRSGQLTSWFVVTDPDGRAEVKAVASPPANEDGASPTSIDRQWHLDTRNGLWLHQGFGDRVYRIDSPDQWPLLRDLGPPEMEYPAGFVWSYRSNRVFPGYEVAGPGFRRACLPTFQTHLTPLFGEQNKVACLTPDGAAWLQFDPEKPDQSAVATRRRIHWNGIPMSYIGHRGTTAFIIVQKSRGSDLVSVELAP